jgi:hypothetical protein
MPRGISGLFKMQRHCSISPRIVELMAPIATNDYFDAQPLRRFRKAARLITQFARKQNQRPLAFGNDSPRRNSQKNVSDCIGGRASDAIETN